MMDDTEHEHVRGTNRETTMNRDDGDRDGEADQHNQASSSGCSDVIDHASPSTLETSPTSSAERNHHQHHRGRRRKQRRAVAVAAGNAGAFLLLGVIMMAVTVTFSCPSTVNAFSSPSLSSSSSSSSYRLHDRMKADMFRSAPTSTSTSSSSSRLGMSLQEVSDFYATYPLQSAILTCGFKASIADSIAQFKDRMKGFVVESHEHDGNNDESDHWWEARRNTAYVIYGGLFVGLMCHMEYNVLFPVMFGTENTPTTFISKVLFDNFISAPLMWLPPAYLIKAVLYDYSLGEGLEKYWRDIRDEGLLLKYWTIWVPAQTVSFSVVPDHLRVAFMASVSFFWFILFSSVSSNGDNTDTDTTNTDNIDAVGPTSVQSDATIEASFFDQPARKSQTLSFDSLHDLYHQDIGVILEAEATRRVNAQNGSARSRRT